MIHMYKLGGNRCRNGVNYSIESVNTTEIEDYVSNGWSFSLDDANCIDTEYEVISETGSDYEAELREQIKALGGKAGGRSSIETLEKQLKELQNGTDS